MRLKSVTVHGMLALRHASVDYSTMGQVVALVGQNGAGKSTLLEAPLAALYRKLVSRPDNPVDVAHDDASYVEAVFLDDDDAEWSARLSLDADRRKVEQHILKSGSPVTNGKAAEVAAAVAEHFGTRELILASVFAAQNREGDFVGLGRAERKALFVEALGLAKLQRLAEAASAERAVSENAVAGQRGRLGALEQRAATRDLLLAGLAAAEVATEEASSYLDGQREKARQLKQEADRLRESGVRYEEAHQAQQRAAQAMRSATAALNAARQHGEALAEQIKSRAARFGSRRESLETRQRGAAAVSFDPVSLTKAQAMLASAKQTAEALQTELDAVRLQLTDARTAYARAETAEQVALAADAEAGRTAKRLTEQADLLSRVPCTDSPIWLDGSVDPSCADLAGTCPLLESARKASTELPSFLRRETQGPAATAAREAALAVVNSLQADLQRISLNGTEARRDLERQTNAVENLKQLAARASQSEAVLEQIKTALDELEKEEQQATMDDFDHQAAASQRVEDASAEVLLQEQATKDADARLAVLRAEMDALQQAEGMAAAAMAEEARASKVLRDREAEQNKLAGQIDALDQELAALPDARAAVAAAEDQVSDWGLLAEVLGRDGVQALEIDAAGPGVADICNELLASCFGPRFCLRFDTLRPNKSKDGHQEVFDIIVFDEGKARRVESLSGGEQVIVKEALALSLAIWNARRNGVRWRTVFRDETSGALSPANAVAYVTMLRRACALGGFERVVFVAHQPEVWARADTRVLVENGTATVE